MAKSSGGVRNVPVGGSAYQKRLAEVAEMRASGKYSYVEMAKNGTGWVAIEKSSSKHKMEEIEAAHHLADKGYKVTLADESGTKVVNDGRLFTASFEQRTPTAEGEKGVNKALEHAKKKGADIAVIYDKHRTYNRAEIEAGIKRYESFNPKYRFKKMIVIGSSGNVHVHTHNK